MHKDMMDYSNPVFTPKSVYAVIAENLLDYVREGDNELMFCSNQKSHFVLLNYMGNGYLCLMNCPTLKGSRDGFEQDPDSIDAFTKALHVHGMDLINNDGCWVIRYNGSAVTDDDRIVGIIAEMMDAAMENAERYSKIA